MTVVVDFEETSFSELRSTACKLATIVLANGVPSNRKLNDMIVDIGLACGMSPDDFSKISSLAFHRKQSEKDSDVYAIMRGYENMNHLLSSLDEAMPDFNAAGLQ